MLLLLCFSFCVFCCFVAASVLMLLLVFSSRCNVAASVLLLLLCCLFCIHGCCYCSAYSVLSLLSVAAAVMMLLQ
jgi:hypothetical protein